MRTLRRAGPAERWFSWAAGYLADQAVADVGWRRSGSLPGAHEEGTIARVDALGQSRRTKARKDRTTPRCIWSGRCKP